MSDLDTKQKDRRKQSLYFPSEILEEIATEAKRIDRSLSWVLKRSWVLARATIKKMPTSVEPGSDSE